MIRRGVRGWLIGVLTSTSMVLALLFWAIPFFLPIALLRLLIPVPAWRRWSGRYLAWVAAVPWLGTHVLILRILHGRRTNIRIESGLDPSRSWLLISNHRSWADILMLLDAFYGKVPFPRFFLKRELFWIPVVGLICWALDMPFMRRQGHSALRSSSAVIDLETTRRFCKRVQGQPVTVINFIEGTRYAIEKRTARDDYQHLLRPRAAGLSFALNAMGRQVAGLVDVTIAYQPTPNPLLWSYLCGEQRGARLEARVLAVPPDLIHGDYAHDRIFRMRFQDWLAAVWQEKDARLGRTLRSS